MYKFEPIGGAPYGAVLRGPTTDKPVDDELIDAVKQGLAQHTLLAINDLDENPDWLLSLGRGFGPLQPHILDQYHHPMSSDMSIITANMGNSESRKTSQPAGAFWHSDLSYTKTPSDAIFLYATHVPEDGGDTMIANMQMAYDALSTDMKSRIANLNAIHRYGWNGGGSITKLSAAQKAKTPDVVHPVVRTHPVNGAKILFVNPGYTMCIADMDREEGNALLSELYEHQQRSEFQYRHKWSSRQLVVIDNRASMHCAVAGYKDPMRKLRMIVGCTDPQIMAA